MADWKASIRLTALFVLGILLWSELTLWSLDQPKGWLGYLVLLPLILFQLAVAVKALRERALEKRTGKVEALILWRGQTMFQEKGELKHSDGLLDFQSENLSFEIGKDALLDPARRLLDPPGARLAHAPDATRLVLRGGRKTIKRWERAAPRPTVRPVPLVLRNPQGDETQGILRRLFSNLVCFSLGSWLVGFYFEWRGFEGERLPLSWTLSTITACFFAGLCLVTWSTRRQLGRITEQALAAGFREL